MARGRAPAGTLATARGAKAAQLTAAMELARRISLPDARKRVVFRKTNKAVDYLRARLQGLSEEHFRALLMNRRGALLEDALLAVGTVDNARPAIRLVVARTLQANASAIIVGHNHPSGAAQPSESDRLFTEDLFGALSPIGVKLLCDEIFTEKRFRNEVIWYYRRWSASGEQFQRQHESLLIYTRSPKSIFNVLYEPYTEGTLKRWKGIKRKTTIGDDGKLIQVEDEEGPEGANMGDVWPISIINANADERTGYPTQKPEELLKRVIMASSDEGDFVMDAFAGSGTALASAEKLKRRWIGIDCGKLAIYTIQKRLLNLRKEIGNKGSKLDPRPFTLYNAGLYDFSKLKELAWQDWRFFALQLFQCRDEPHKIGGIEFDGYRQGASVLVFNHQKHKDARITEETVEEIHEAVGSRVGNKVFIIAPALAFDFQQDYVDFDRVRYYALRIPYSIIHELHRREFTALKQPSDELAVNDTVEAVGFDFIRTPTLVYKTGAEKPKGEAFENGFIQIETFKSDAVIREPSRKRGNLETLSMVMLDFDYDEDEKVFDLDELHYAEAIEKADWKVCFCTDQLGKKMMAVFLDIYGNEARILIDAAEFGKGGGDSPRRPKR